MNFLLTFFFCLSLWGRTGIDVVQHEYPTLYSSVVYEIGRANAAMLFSGWTSEDIAGFKRAMMEQLHFSNPPATEEDVRKVVKGVSPMIYGYWASLQGNILLRRLVPKHLIYVDENEFLRNNPQYQNISHGDGFVFEIRGDELIVRAVLESKANDHFSLNQCNRGLKGFKQTGLTVSERHFPPEKIRLSAASRDPYLSQVTYAQIKKREPELFRLAHVFFRSEESIPLLSATTPDLAKISFLSGGHNPANSQFKGIWLKLCIQPEDLQALSQLFAEDVLTSQNLEMPPHRKPVVQSGPPKMPRIRLTVRNAIQIVEDTLLKENRWDHKAVTASGHRRTELFLKLIRPKTFEHCLRHPHLIPAIGPLEDALLVHAEDPEIVARGVLAYQIAFGVSKLGTRPFFQTDLWNKRCEKAIERAAQFNRG